MELARVTNLKPRIEAESTSKRQQLGHQSTNASASHLERLNLDETQLYREPNTPEESYQVSKPELDSKVLALLLSHSDY